MDLTATDVSKWAKIITVVAQGLTSGSAYYITMVEAPARMTHDMPTAVRNWKPFFDRAKNSQMLVSSFSILGGLAIYYLDHGTPRSCIGWPVASCMIATVIPYTIFGMMPLNRQLLETEKCIEKGDGWIKDSLTKWANFHSVRTIINVGAFGLMVYSGFMCSNK